MNSNSNIKSSLTYNFEELRIKNKSNTKFPKLNNIIFKYKIFRKFYWDYFSRTPESDSLYRRRNRLMILVLSGIFYYKTSSKIFNRIELEIFSMHRGFSMKKIFIPLSKSFYFICLIFISQLLMKYIYYLNKVFKSYQFALEGVLKYNIIEKNYVYRGDSNLTGRFDIIDSENIKKNQ
jgi:hypothetical protein